MTTLYQIGGRLVRIGSALGSGASAGGGGGGSSPDNTMSLTNVSGSTVTNQPLPFARIFAEGEIADSPDVLIDGTPVTTGADVKTRWGDGSVQHALLAVVVSSMTNNVAKEITFQNNASADNTALTKSEMLDARFDFDAVISMTVGGVTHTASARTMLTNDDYVVWRSNQVATEIILCDHSSSAAYDMTWSSVPHRPIFHATFWNALNKVRVRCIGELANATALGDLSVTSLSITKGSASPTSAYSKASFTAYLGTRWTKEFWIGTAPASAVNLDHNLSYLKETMAFPNYDLTLDVSGTISSYYSTWWTGKSTDIYDAGPYERYMPTAGTRPEIGPIPTWATLWLYSGDYRMRTLSLGAADLAGAWPLHFREPGSSTKRLMRTDTVASGTGAGLPISLTDRKTTALVAGYDWGNVGDMLTVVGSNAQFDWIPDLSHQPDPFSTQYSLTGDYFYIEQMKFWASASAHWVNGSGTTLNYGRGPTGAEGNIASELRGRAWGALRRAQTHYYTPDDDVMKDYFGVLLDDTLAAFEGRYNITTGTYNGTTMWTWMQTGTTDDPPREKHSSNTLHWGVKNDTIPDGDAAHSGQSMWMQYYSIVGFGLMKELGYSTDKLCEWMGVCLIGMINDPDFNPFMISDYQTANGPNLPNPNFYDNWLDVFNEAPTLNQDKTSLGVMDSTTIDHPYGFVATCATAYLTGYTGGAAARAWCETNGYNVATGKETNPKWCILPRT